MTSFDASFYKVYPYRGAIHVFFWSCWCLFYSMVGARYWLYMLVNMATLLPCTYFLVWYLHRSMPRLHENYTTLKLVVLWVFTAAAHLFLDKVFTYFVFGAAEMRLHLVFYEYAYALFFVISIPVTIEMLFLMLKNSIEMRDLQSKQHEVEMQLLKSQINPHFLFNTMNSIYSLSLATPEKVPSVVLGLSDLMRYMLTESKKETVLLRHEIAYLENYVRLERLRLNSADAVVFTVQGNLNALRIAPMLLLPFIENAFKHGNTAQIKGNLIEIVTSVQNSELFLYIKNVKRQQNAEETQVESTSIGLANLYRRLEILYPDRYKLEIEDSQTHYVVHFWIDLNG